MINHFARKNQGIRKSNIVNFPTPKKLTARQEEIIKLFQDTLGLSRDVIEGGITIDQKASKNNVITFKKPVNKYNRLMGELSDFIGVPIAEIEATRERAKRNRNRVIRIMEIMECSEADAVELLEIR